MLSGECEESGEEEETDRKRTEAGPS